MLFWVLKTSDRLEEFMSCSCVAFVRKLALLLELGIKGGGVEGTAEAYSLFDVLVSNLAIWSWSLSLIPKDDIISLLAVCSYFLS